MLSLEYIAGFIDGEGGFSTRPKNTYTPHLHIGNTHKGVVYMIMESVKQYTGLDRGMHVSVQDWFRTNRGHRTSYRLWVGGRPLAKFLPMVLPYLVVKKAQAEIAIGLIDLIAMHGNNGIPLSEEEFELRKDMGDCIKLHNQGLLQPA